MGILAVRSKNGKHDGTVRCAIFRAGQKNCVAGRSNFLFASRVRTFFFVFRPAKIERMSSQTLFFSSFGAYYRGNTGSVRASFWAAKSFRKKRMSKKAENSEARKTHPESSHTGRIGSQTAPHLPRFVDNDGSSQKLSCRGVWLQLSFKKALFLLMENYR